MRPSYMQTQNTKDAMDYLMKMHSLREVRHKTMCSRNEQWGQTPASVFSQRYEWKFLPRIVASLGHHLHVIRRKVHHPARSAADRNTAW